MSRSRRSAGKKKLSARRSASRRLWHDDAEESVYPSPPGVPGRRICRRSRLPTISQSPGMISARSQSKHAWKSTGMAQAQKARKRGGGWSRRCKPISHARNKVLGLVVRRILKICPRDAEPRPDGREEAVVEIESEGTAQMIPDPSDPLIGKLPATAV